MSSAENPITTQPVAVEPLIKEIMALLGQVSEKLEPGNNELKQWLVQNSPHAAIAEILQDSTMMTLRVLDAIGRLEPVNGITISKQFHIPKGSVSKTTRRLIAKKLIKQESLPNNKKEVLFRLTPLGQQVLEVNRAFDQQMGRGFVRFLQRYNDAELRLLVRVPRPWWDTCAGVHQVRGRQTVAEFVTLEAAHDLNHLRQIDRILANVSTGRAAARRSAT